MSVLCISLNPALDLTLSLEQLTLGAVNRTTDERVQAAGKGVNVACVLSELGADVALSGFLGQENSAPFVSLFSQLKIDNQCIMVAGATRQNVKIAESDGQVTDVNGRGFVVSPKDINALQQRVAELVADAQAVVVSGSLPRGFSQEDFKALLLLIKQYTPKLIVDTSGAALRTAVACQPFLIKPNSAELTESFGLPADTKQAQQVIVDKHLAEVANVVVSMGADGVRWFSKAGNLEATAPPISVKSTVGAGDTLTAALTFGLLCENLARPLVLQQAVAQASFVASIIGVGIADETTVQKLTQSITISAF